MTTPTLKPDNNTDQAIDNGITTIRSHKIIGFSLMAISTLLWVVALIIPFLDFNWSDSAWIIGVLIIIAEVMFYIGVLMLGKTLWQKYKTQLMEKLQAMKQNNQ